MKLPLEYIKLAMKNNKISSPFDPPFVTVSSDLLSRIDLDELMKKDEPPFTFPKTLEEFEYAFNEGKSVLKAQAPQEFCSFLSLTEKNYRLN